MFNPDEPACVRKAFDDAWTAIFETRVQAALSRPELHKFLPGFTTHYRRLTALPRRTRRSMQRQWKRTLGVIALLMTLGQTPAWAATIELTPGTPPSINVDGKCSLIEAIVNANRDRRTHLDCVAGEGADTIVLPAKSTQRLRAAESLPQITSPIVIEGRQSTIQRNTTQHSYLPFFRVSATGDLTLNRTTVSGATASGVLGGREGVLNEGGSVTLNDSTVASAQTGLLNILGGRAVLRRSTISGSRKPVGSDEQYTRGGIDNGGILLLTNSVVTENVSQHEGAGIYNHGRLTMIDSIVSNNRFDGSYRGSGGGIKNNGTLILVGSTVSGNHGTDFGGGISSSGTATLRGCTVSGNVATSPYNYFGGGGIEITSGTLTLDNCTVSNNVGNMGGGVWVENGGALTVSNSTVTGNYAGGRPQDRGPASGGLFIERGTLTLHRSIVSGNTARLPGAQEIAVNDYYTHVITADDYNLFGHDGDAGVEGFIPGSTDLVPNQPIGGILLPLADNGGGTQTHALSIGSPALDASPDDVACPPSDQRGNPRPRGPACDIGAFEGVAVSCNGKVTTMVGTINDDRLTGTAGSDVISGLLGNDTVYGLEGNDVVCAGSGDDIVYGGPDSDLLLGEPGNDRLFGQGGNDTLNGGVGQDACDGGPGAADAATTCETVKAVP
jgi:hypothetical protein